jgi:hypothetical protein
MPLEFGDVLLEGQTRHVLVAGPDDTGAVVRSVDALGSWVVAACPFVAAGGNTRPPGGISASAPDPFNVSATSSATILRTISSTGPRSSSRTSASTVTDDAATIGVYDGSSFS